jgi:hypothetical protein
MEYSDSYPRHSHRTPADIAEDEKFAALRGEFFGVLVPPETHQKPFVDPYLVPRQRALVPWVDRPRPRRSP